MAHSSEDIFEPKTHNALDELAREPELQILNAPVDAEGCIQLMNFTRLEKVPLTITVQSDAIHVERASGESFGIADCSHDRDHPIPALGQAVARLTVERHEHGWRLRHDPERQVDVKSPSSIDLFWRTVATYTQMVRTERALRDAQPKN